MWLAGLVVLTLRRRPATPRAGPATLDLGPEPPAVVNFLTHGFSVTPDAVPATLLDLAARGVLTLEHRGPDAFVCRLGRAREGLTDYEQRVVALLRDRMSGGIVPPQALTLGPASEAGSWRKQFDAEVVADARRRGLSRPVLDGKLVFWLLVGSGVPGVLLWLSTRFHSGLAGLLFVIGAVLLLGWVVSLHPQRETPAGLAAASRWLGLRAALHEDEVFPTLPPITVGIWRRYLAYGAALGVAPGAVGPIPMGAESDSRAWTSYGGRWRAVRVDYPSFLPVGWGLHPLLGLFRGAVIGAVSGSILFALTRLPDLAFAAPLLVPPSLAALTAIFLLAKSLVDLPTTPLIVKGEILRLRAIGDRNRRLYAAVDDVSSARIRAFVVQPSLYARLEQASSSLPPSPAISATCGESSRREARRPSRWPGRLGRFLLASPAEDDATEREAEPEGADGEGADRDHLPPLGQPLPAREGRFFLGRERLAAPALPDRAAGAQTEVEIVEELGRLVHAMSV